VGVGVGVGVEIFGKNSKFADIFQKEDFYLLNY